MAQDTLQEEQRIARRLRVLKQGKILTANNMSIIDCTVRDMSATGAKIICGDQAAVPNEFRLVTPVDNLLRDVHVKWRRGDQIGVHFVGEARRAPPRKW